MPLGNKQEAHTPLHAPAATALPSTGAFGGSGGFGAGCGDTLPFTSGADTHTGIRSLSSFLSFFLSLPSTPASLAKPSARRATIAKISRMAFIVGTSRPQAARMACKLGVKHTDAV